MARWGVGAGANRLDMCLLIAVPSRINEVAIQLRL
jgi:hypothetical protein